MKYKGYSITTSKSGKTYIALKAGKIQTWSICFSMKHCKKYIDQKTKGQGGD